ncbi:hypothetical protein [Natronolimnohabitans innermongolicus]|nr:hypothetical protein [Natronolimnohabitans innermongolicus]
MPHVPDFPTPTDGSEEDRGESNRSIIDRLIGSGDDPTPTGG